MAPGRKASRWYAQIYWRQADPERKAVSPVLPWKLLKSYLDGVLTRSVTDIEQIIIRPAGGEEPSDQSSSTGAERE